MAEERCCQFFKLLTLILWVLRKCFGCQKKRQFVGLQAYIEIYVVLDLRCFHVNGFDVCKLRTWPCESF